MSGTTPTISSLDHTDQTDHTDQSDQSDQSDQGAPLSLPGEQSWSALGSRLEGELERGTALRLMYATDASSYREIPAAVVYPRHLDDLKVLLAFARKHRLGLIPRTAGTSLAGQVVGSGIVVDLSRHMTAILDLNKAEGTVTVQPGVIRDELNRYLKPHGWYFGPETSTANRAMIGGMVGNNSCGSNSIVYGSTREHVLKAEVLLSDGSEVVLESLKRESVLAKGQQKDLEGALYRQVIQWWDDPSVQADIREHFPKPEIPRRNTGYALDKLLEDSDQLNLCRILCGSEGTLALAHAITLSLSPLPPAHRLLVCAHFSSLDESLRANLVALRFTPGAVELMDHYLLDCTKDSLAQRANRFFLQGEPKAVLVIELLRDTVDELDGDAQALIQALQQENYGYAYPIVSGEDIRRVWDLRKAGLGLLSNIPGDAKPVPVIEDTAVSVTDLPDYIRDFNRIMDKMGLYCVHYAHAGSGELHLRPILNLKTAEGQRLFRQVAEAVAGLVKQYGGSLSGEHGDGRLRGEFLEKMVGEANYRRMVALKQTWDPEGILNPGKIVHTPPMDARLRYEGIAETTTFSTVFSFRRERGMLRAVEQCNGSGDCRKLPEAGGTMCPSYQASREERDTTRARANVLREILSRQQPASAFEDPVLDEVLDRCLSCKGCTGECPSNVDMARYKAEWLYQKHRRTGFPIQSRLFANAGRLNDLAGSFAPLSNWVMQGRIPSVWMKRLMGVHPKRALPMVHGRSLEQWMRRDAPVSSSPLRGRVWFFTDPFSNRLDVEAGKAAVRLLSALGYAVERAPLSECGRTFLSKGFLPQAKQIAIRNVRTMAPLVSKDHPLIGLEPSSILTFKDEYPDLVDDADASKAEELAKHCYLLEDFLMREADAGRIGPEDFDSAPRHFALHGHCHQKALVGVSGSAWALGLPAGHAVQVIPSGCCGMAGSFGYEERHFDLSMQIGELVLFPAIRQLPADVAIAAPGTSCRHQIKDGTGRIARHPAEWLWEAVRKEPRKATP